MSIWQRGGHIASMKNKAWEWIDKAKEVKMQQRDVWFPMDHQLWPKVGYILCSLSTPRKELDGCLRQKWWQLVPLGGLVSLAPHQLQNTSIGLCCSSCPHVGVECLIAQLNRLLVHYGCKSNTGLKLQLSLESMLVEHDLSGQSFQESCEQHESWVTRSWLKSL